MFTLFKSSNQLVEEIHNEIDSAQDRLLDEAKKIIDCHNGDALNKAKRLANVGFVNSETVLGINLNSIVESKEQALLIEYYKQNYPFQKFITEKEMDRICKKYNLIYAPVSNYKKDVPEKNLREIENVNIVKYGDAPEDMVIVDGFQYNHLKLENEWFKKNIGIGKPIRASLVRDNHFGSIPVGGGYTFLSKIKTISKQGLFIAAPKTHFNLKGLENIGLFGFMVTSVFEQKDPIVFRYCRGGIQIITKWGLEASDEIVVNEKMN